MAEIRKIVRRDPISNFQQVAPAGGGAFRVLAEAAGAAYDFLAPEATRQMQEAGNDLGREMARRQIGSPELASANVSSKGAVPQREFSGGVSEKAKGALSALEGNWGRKLNVISDYRDPNKNAAVGGAKRSKHMDGDAFDVDVSDMSQAERVDLIKRARASGFSGVGVYKNSLHFDVGGDRAWGASYKRDSLPAWAAEAVSAPIGQQAGQAATVSTKEAPTMIRKADGSLEARLFSPLGGPMLQAHNAAAGVAYQSEMMVQAATDLMGLSSQFELDPEGFKQAADGYIADVVDKAPDLFKTDLRTTLDRELKSRFLGMVEERQGDIRRRAANSSAALVDRLSGNLASALAAGNDEDAAAIQSELDGVLAARETLPGLSWTPEQSENVRLKAGEEAERIREKNRTSVSGQVKSALRTIIKAATNGRSAEDEAILDDPGIADIAPDEYREALATVTLRDTLPAFLAMPPAQQKAALAEMRANPVGEEWEVDLFKAAESAAKENETAWKADPIARAAEVLPEKPPALAQPDDPEGFVASMAARREYGRKLQAEGYVRAPNFLSNDEAEMLGLAIGKGSPPEIRAALAGAIVSGFGDDAVRVFQELKANDPVIKIGGMMVASGGDQKILSTALQGQAMLDEGLVQKPTRATSYAAVSTDIVTALSDVPGAIQAETDVMALATAIYAADARGVDPTSDAAKTLMEASIQKALGQSTDRNNRPTGGVQTIGGFPTLMPIGVSGEDVNDAIERSFERKLNFGQMIAPIFGDMPIKAPEIWEAAGVGLSKGSFPMVGGKPLDPSQFRVENLKIIPVGNTGAYVMEIRRGGGGVAQVRDATGGLFQFDLKALIEAAQ